jgi:tRNA pseudouridine55 synthase
MAVPEIGGVLLLDKPEGWTSNAALGRTRRLLGGVKAGHTGTLDPFASGLLPITVGEAGKFSRYLLDADKRYEATLKLGAVSTTGDPEGEISPTDTQLPTSWATIQQVLESFMGMQDQTPPMYSALKQQGVPLYKLARQGLEVPRAPRQIQIHELRVLDWQGGDCLTLQVLCSKGTYVRVLAEDIGQALGCGAYLTGLRRTAVGPLDIAHAIDIKGLEALPEDGRADRLLPGSTLVSGLPKVQLDRQSARALLDGKHPNFPGQLAGEVQAWGPEGVFLGVASALAASQGSRLVPVRMMSPTVLP